MVIYSGFHLLSQAHIFHFSADKSGKQKSNWAQTHSATSLQRILFCQGKNEDKIFGMTRKCFMMMGSGTSSLKRFFISATTGYLAIVIRTCFRIKRPNIQRKQCYMQCHYMVMLIDEQSRQHFELHLNSKMNKKTKRVPMRSFAKLIHIVI